MLHDEFYSDLCVWIENNLETPLSLTEIANKAGYGKWYLQRLFKSKMGITLGKYILNRRITRAALALRFSSLSITEIFLLSGFDSQQAFTRVFKNHFGITPAVYSKHEHIHFKGFQRLIHYPFTFSNQYFLTTRKMPVAQTKIAVRMNIEELININFSREHWRAPLSEFFSQHGDMTQFTMIVAIVREDLRSHLVLQELSLLVHDSPELKETEEAVDCLTFPFSGKMDAFLFFRSYVYYNLIPDIDASITGAVDFFEGKFSHCNNETWIEGSLYIPVCKLGNIAIH